MISERNIYIAYRKLKGECYHNTADLSLRFKLAQWEENLLVDGFRCSSEQFENRFTKSVSKLKSILDGDNPIAFNDLINQINYHTEIKSFTEKETAPEEGLFITNHAVRSNLSVESLNYKIDAPIELHLISLLWVMYANKYLNDKLYNHNFANRLREDTLPEPDGNSVNAKGIDLSISQAYFYGYQKWRDKAISTVNEILDKRMSATLLSLDIQRYYYSIRLNFNDTLDINTRLGYLDEGYKEDSDFMFLSELVQRINARYTSLLKDKSFVRSQAEFKDGETLLLVGLASSTLLGNLYLTDFDERVSSIDACVYYGRYVDDMLFVFKGKLIKGSAKNRIAAFIKRFFINNKILQYKEDSNYLLVGKPNMKIQGKKVVIEYFSSQGSRAALKIFTDKLKKRSSAFRFLLDDDSSESEFDNAAYNLEYTDSANKLRSIKAFREDKLGASLFLARKIALAGVVEEDPKEKNAKAKRDTDSRTAKQILDFFKGRIGLEFFALWEKVATYFVVKDDIKSLEKFYKGTKASIEKIRFNSDAVLGNNKELIRLKKDMLTYLNWTIAMPLSLRINKIRDLGNHGIDLGEEIFVEAKHIRHANLFRHYLLNFDFLNYSDNLVRDEIDLLSRPSSELPLDNYEDTIASWLSPRFVYLHELSIYSLLLDLHNGSEIQEVANHSFDIYSQINFKWTVLFGGNQIPAPQLFTQRKILPLDGDVHKPTQIIIKALDGFVNQKLQVDKKAGVVNMKVQDSNYKRPLKGYSPNLSSARRDELYTILDDSRRSLEKCDILCLPEISVPLSWLGILNMHSRKENMAIVAGMEHIVVNNIAYNIVVTILPVHISKYYTDSIVLARIKKYYSPGEKSQLKESKKPLSWPSAQCQSNYLFNWRGIYFSVFNCFELTSIDDRSLFKGYVDFIVVTELNPDTYYYSDIVGSTSRDLYCYVIQVNSSEYGDSRITQPTGHVQQNKVRIKGGKAPVVMIDTLEIGRLREEAKQHAQEYEDGESVKKTNNDNYFKPTPPGLSKDLIDARINGTI